MGNLKTQEELMEELGGDELLDENDRGVPFVPAELHEIGRLLGEGKTVDEVAAITKSTVSRIKKTLQHPDVNTIARTIQAASRKNSEAVFNDVLMLAKLVGDEMLDRLIKNPTSFTNSELAGLFRAMQDRVGNAPIHKVEVGFADSFGENLRKAHERVEQLAKERNEPGIIDGTAIEVEAVDE